MPTYEYACDENGHNFEIFQRFVDQPLSECTVCGAPVRRVIHAAGVIFKGDGWYVTANRSNDEKSKYQKDERGESSSDKSSTEPIKAAANGESSKNDSPSSDSGGDSSSPAAGKKSGAATSS
ncbi:MAG: hypothetical protein OXG11_01115 [Chloroflexi bacterium]|nr:hypothetical protein [Chloroflexota bacterium]